MNPDEIREALAKLNPDQRAKLEERLRAASAPSTSRAIPRRPDPEEYPLSPGQERLWALSRLQPGEPTYNIDAVWRLRGPVEPNSLETAFRTIVGRHEPLRARITNDSGRPVQSLRAASGFRLDLLDLSAREIHEDLLVKEIDRLTSEPFDLANDFLIRATLIRIDELDHVLVVVAHHIACDGWSFSVLASELGSAYTAVKDESEVRLPELQVSFADIAHWQRTEGTRSSDLDYWATRLSDVEPLRLPRARTNRHYGREGTTLAFDIDADLTSRVSALARRHQITSFSVLLAAYQATLNRITGQERLLLCTPVAGRGRIEMEPLIGYFNNLIPLAGQVTSDPTLEDMMKDAATTVSEAFDHSTPAFQEIAALDAVADKPLSRSLFVLQDDELARPELPDVEVETVTHDSDTSDFDLAVFLRPVDESLRGAVAFRPSVIDPRSVSSVMADFVAVLEAAVEQPEMHLSHLPDLGGAQGEATDVETTMNATGPASLLEARLHQLWERVFRRRVGLDEDFFDLGGHSLLAAELIGAIENEFDLDQIPLSALFEAPTVARFSRWLEETGPRQRWSSLVPIKPTGDRPPLFFVHAHGGNVIGYSDLGRHLSSRQPLYGIQSPRGDLGVRHIEEIAESYLTEVRTAQENGPYVLGGWCLGGDVAFEMARQLRESGEEVALVLMVDNPRPEHAEEGTDGTRGLLNRVTTRLEMEWANLREAPSHVSYAIDRTWRLIQRLLLTVENVFTNDQGRLPFGLEHSQVHRRGQVAAQHEKAYESYVPGRYDGRVAVFRAELQPRGRVEDPALGWTPYVTGEILDYELPGHRLGMLSEPRIQRSARIIEDAIVRALEHEGPE